MTNIKNYVLGFAFSRNGNKVVLIEKNRPEWQKGKLNGVGGKVDPEDNSPSDAMIREFKEETGVDSFIGGLHGWHHFATMVFKNDIMGGEANVFCFKMSSNIVYQCKTMEDEKVNIFNIEDLKLHPLMDNVKNLLNLCKSEFNFIELIKK